ncbi:MAG: bifunctional [glutamate--ammonia ligase]-adenylyl-L-tyrosine phosphorylase/[glutamate--ammonia-ligase] adenylyltransferase [Desulfobacterales bacterium]|nr:bifunctional [glutamate--ammonia ligase]-adenylyl-L-tyrosine phosphorylase/[glutamate--ammonia-ligase] adenylyltransferase [Desulfobacterales bacterium]MDD3081172.1 bifunctional [glutamate--ammonia ligase]-adenylyl-L-tyrosine phosphorylase/[glutamate--ammonia-ligase] adenylyltransferase [Desulfobacterales bacterium]MDD3950556.1 bifunctional [glutamate--ammonia ligase]-adenylyl-L-tyrosine phosphorylase/[glutamate--ammonia-ligase] adenylyltransferase [Desulfobacterales bacterium]MDY0377149.1 bi
MRMPLLAAPLIVDAEKKWSVFQQAALQSDISTDYGSGFLETLKRVFAFSDFVAKNCIRRPELLDELIRSGDLQTPGAPGACADRLRAALDGVLNEKCLAAALRRFRQREMIRIAWRDLAGWADLNETTASLSELADQCLDQTLSIIYENLCRTYGEPADACGNPQQLVVIGMGKLGAWELNFSSDIDLIFAYPEAGQTRNGPVSIENEEFFTRLCRRLINLIGAKDSDGFVFRVDMALRPYGENGALVMSFDNMEEYYQTQGREWERYALIKARVAAGDRIAGARLLERLKPFVYRRYLDYGVFESLREMKEKISLEVQRKGMKDNVKLGPGGIREIEFFGQIFQLIRGGVRPRLQQQRIDRVLEHLVGEGYVNADVCRQLLEAYAFLRNTEHRLQEFSDSQIHALPRDALGKIRLAASMGFDDWTGFEKCLQSHMQTVHSHFNRLLGNEHTQSFEEQTLEKLNAVWRGATDSEYNRNTLEKAGFEDPQTVLSWLEDFRNSTEFRSQSSEARKRLNRIMPVILKQAGAAPNPMANLNRILDLLKAIQRRSCYIALLLESPTALDHLVKLAGASPWIMSFLTRHPALLDELIDPRTLYAPPLKDALEQELQRRLEGIDPEDLELQMDALRIFKQVNVLRVAAADITGVLPLMKVSDRLTYIAETVLNHVIRLSWNHLTQKHGAPTCRLNGQSLERGFAVIGYGKLGGIELGYVSDLDLVFLHAGVDGQTSGAKYPIHNAQFFARLGQRVIHLLTAHTSAGILYETDMRLRPSGTSGILVSHIAAFEDYQKEKAWTWEHQALIKARPIAGDGLLALRFEDIRRQVLARPRTEDGLREEILSMRSRMRSELLKHRPGWFDLKQGPGGIVDIEFIVQYLVLLHAHTYPELMRWTDIVRLLQSLMETGILDPHTAHTLRQIYLIYRAAGHRLSLQQSSHEIPEERFAGLQQRVAGIWKAVLGNRAQTNL